MPPWLTHAFFIIVFGTKVLAAYDPPVGIPAPGFGIEESHAMYEGRNFDYNGDGVDEAPYKNSGNGPYTHYIHNNSPFATDTANPLGTFDKPRLTMPTVLPAGSVVELHSGSYTFKTTAYGIPGKPVFVRGIDATALPIVTNAPGLTGSSYLIIENLNVRSERFPIFQRSHHISIRYCDFSGTPMPAPGVGGASFLYTWANTGWEPGQTIEDIVVFRNRIHDNGDFPASFESGIHGIGITKSTLRMWVLENEIFRNAEDGIHILGGGRGDHARFIYIGRNQFYQDGENAIDVKQSFDVIISENSFYGYRRTQFPEGGSDGAAIVLNNDSPNDRLWIINNRIWDSTIGIRSQSSGSVFVIGNVFSNLKHEEGQSHATSPGRSAGVALWTSGSTNLVIQNNTVHNSDGGFYVSGGRQILIQNNLVANLRESDTYHFALGTGTFAVANNLAFDPEVGPRLRGYPNPQTVISANPQLVSGLLENLQLLPISPAINAGKVSEVYSTFQSLYDLSIAKDIRGMHRPIATAPDIGAYQFSPALAIRADFNNRVKIWWSNDNGPYLLQMAPSLSFPSEWSLVPNVPLIAGSESAVYFEISPGAAFFSLMK